jgi:hypothetical protein
MTNSLTIPVGSFKVTLDKDGKVLPMILQNDAQVIMKPGETISMNNLTAFKKSSRFDFQLEGNLDMDNIVSILYGSDKTASDINLGDPIPSGTYTFSIIFKGKTEKTASFNLSNPSGYVQLIGPGSEFQDQDPDVIYTKTPVIRWIGDAPDYRVTVVEVGSNDKSIDELKTKTPSFQITTKSNTVQVPASGNGLISPLKVGKVYAILLESQINTLGSTKPIGKIATPIWFKVGSPQSGSEAQAGNLIFLLKSLFGSEYEKIFDQLKDGQVTGTITLNGTQINAQKLQDIANKFRAGTYQVQKITVN